MVFWIRGKFVWFDNDVWCIDRCRGNVIKVWDNFLDLVIRVKYFKMLCVSSFRDKNFWCDLKFVWRWYYCIVINKVFEMIYKNEMFRLIIIRDYKYYFKRKK